MIPRYRIQYGVFVFFLFLCAEIAAAQQNPTKDKRAQIIGTIVKCWQARQEKVSSFEFIWSEESTIPKGAYSGILAELPALNGKPLGESEVLPPHDKTVARSVSLSIHGKKMRFGWEGSAWSMPKKTFVPSKYTSTFDETDAKVSLPVSDRYPAGINGTEKQNPDVKLSAVKPLLWTYRLCSSVSNIRIDEFALASERPIEALIDNSRCVVLKTKANSTQDYLFWVDMDRECIVRRVSLVKDEKPRLEFNIQYKKDEIHGWTPSGWQIVSQNDDGSIKESNRSTVLTFSINELIPASEFTLKHEPGTVVTDVASTRVYIVTPSGGKRFLSAEELALDYEAKLKLRESSPIGSWMLLIGIVAVGVLFAKRRYWRRPRVGESKAGA